MKTISYPKVVAIYLPQFYKTPYNSKWWGEGYTEWTACKQAKPLFSGHYQPRIPYENNYYDLSKCEDIQNQALLARQFGIDGFAIYHYYSCGNVLLNTPIEILYDNKQINIEYYFYWANHDWRKNWFGQESELIWPQKYGNQDDWIKHYCYCKRFFKDERYMKIDNKPIFAIFQDWEFPEISKFIDLWNSLAKKDGFNGIYFVKTVTARNNKKLGKFNGLMEREPFFVMAKGEKNIKIIKRILFSRIYNFLNNYKIYNHLLWIESYPQICKLISDMHPGAGSNTFLGAFTGWDNTPRKQWGGSLFLDESSDIFEDCIYHQILKAKKYGCPQIIINAWNEWAEGSYLEPDEKNKYNFLKAVKNAKSKCNIITDN